MVYEGGGGVEKVQKTVYVVYEWLLYKDKPGVMLSYLLSS